MKIWRWLMPWLLLIGIGAAILYALHIDLKHLPRAVIWQHPRAMWLLLAIIPLGLLVFSTAQGRLPTLGFSQVEFARYRGWRWWLSDFPAVLRMVAIALLAVALGRPTTFKTINGEIDSIDIMLVFDLSRSMEEADMARDRLDAAQRVVRRFLKKNKNDRIGLAVFAQAAMLQCPLTSDVRTLDQIIADLQIGDVPEMGTAIGDGLALALAQLRKSDAKSKVVILLSDGDSNFVTQFDTDDAAAAARKMGIKVYTVLVGAESSGLFGGMDVNPDTLKSIATITGGHFYMARDEESFDKGFTEVRKTLDKTKRRSQEQIPEHELFVWFVFAALALLAAERIMQATAWRRVP
jgi:Ca-activated chloride channel homolog